MGKETLRLISERNPGGGGEVALVPLYSARKDYDCAGRSRRRKNDLCPCAGGAAYDGAAPAGKRFGTAAPKRHLPDGGGRAGGYDQASVDGGGRGLLTCTGHRRKPEGTDPSGRASGAGCQRNRCGADRARPATGVSWRRCGHAPSERGAARL